MNDELMSRLYDESKVYRDTEWGEKVQFFDHRKFAELIIDQCCKACETATTEDQPLHLVSLGYSQRIKEHFGVK